MSEVMERPQAEAEKRAVVLDPQNCALREQWRNDWVVEAAEGTSIEDVLRQEYWSLKARELHKFDRIEVVEVTGAWLVELLVLACDRTWAKVHMLQKHVLEEPTDVPQALDRYSIDWKGNSRKFAVIRKADKAVIQEGFTSRPEALAWLANHERVTT